ncbi:hypothetical protein ACFL20_05500 [Spirochaetota bacterium]
MNNIKKILILTTLIIFASANYAESKSRRYDKTIGFSFDPVSMIILGPSFSIEFSGLGAVGIFTEATYVGPGFTYETITKDAGFESEGFTVGGGLKYYISYKKSYHDSWWLGVSYNYLRIYADYDNGDSMIANGSRFLFLTGLRWQWPVVFLDTYFGVGYQFAEIDENGANISSGDIDKLNSMVNGFAYAVGARVGVSF